MRYLSVTPNPGVLSPYVDAVWFCEIPAAIGSETLLATSRPQMVFGLDQAQSDGLVQGPLRAPRAVNSALQRRAVGVSLRRGGLVGLNGAPAGDWSDELLSTDCFFGPEARILHEQLQETADRDPVAAMGRLLEFLVERATAVAHDPDLRVRAACDLISQGVPIRDVARFVELDQRALVSRFRAEVGFAPKSLSRVERFEALTVALRQADAPDLAALAVDAGYSDQAHMTREFREFGLVTPASIHRDAAASPTHLTT